DRVRMVRAPLWQPGTIRDPLWHADAEVDVDDEQAARDRGGDEDGTDGREVLGDAKRVAEERRDERQLRQMHGLAADRRARSAVHQPPRAEGGESAEEDEEERAGELRRGPV